MGGDERTPGEEDGVDSDGGRDLLAGAGFWSDEEADRVREARERYKEKSKERRRRRAGEDG